MATVCPPNIHNSTHPSQKTGARQKIKNANIQISHIGAQKNADVYLETAVTEPRSEPTTYTRAQHGAAKCTPRWQHGTYALGGNSRCRGRRPGHPGTADSGTWARPTVIEPRHQHLFPLLQTSTELVPVVVPRKERVRRHRSLVLRVTIADALSNSARLLLG